MESSWIALYEVEKVKLGQIEAYKRESEWRPSKRFALIYQIVNFSSGKHLNIEVIHETCMVVYLM